MDENVTVKDTLAWIGGAVVLGYLAKVTVRSLAYRSLKRARNSRPINMNDVIDV